MAELLKGAPAAAALNEKNKAAAEALRSRGVIPCLAVLRVGEREDDLSYERGAKKRCEAAGADLRSVVLPADVSQDELLRTVDALNRDPSVHGILPLRPMPAQIDDEALRRALAPEKDVDGITDGSLAGVFTGSGTGFAPCTAQAVIELLDYYKVPLQGKNIAVVGRSLVIGRPCAMLLMARGATVTICHSRTQNLSAVTRGADIVVAAIGKMRFFTADYFLPGQTVVDVGIHFDQSVGKMCGDVDTEAAAAVVNAVSPVPGGVGSMTTAILVSHVVEAAQRMNPCI